MTFIIKREYESQNLEKNNKIDDFATINLLYTPCLLKALEKEELLAINEVDEYMKLSEISLKKDPLAWWDLHSKKFPILSKLARIFLAIPATSTPSERLFSDAGNLMSFKRMRISPELFNRMMFLKRNIDQYQSIHPPE